MFGSTMMSLGLEAGPFDQQPEGAFRDLDLAFDGVGLAVLVEAHHDDGRPVPATLGLREEVVLALLQADRVHDGLALDALQAGLDRRPTWTSRS